MSARPAEIEGQRALPPVDVSATANVARRLTETALAMPDGVAVIVPKGRGADGRRGYERHSFRELEEESERLARGLVHLGARPGMRLALLVRPGYEFIALVFALFKAGAVQVLIDPGMGGRNAVNCLAEIEPQGFIAIPPAQAVRKLLATRFSQARLNVTVGHRWFWGGPTLDDVRAAGDRTIQLPAVQPDDPAAIIFTTGSTGSPKGVLYRHRHFDRQVEAIRDQYHIRPGEIDVACFPLFALFNSAMGVTSVFPEMDASRPARVDPARIVEAVEDLGATQAFGSPAVWDRVGRYCEERGLRMASLRRVLSAGAPVPAHVLARMKAAIDPAGEVHTPYGATEALPVATIEAREVLDETAGRTALGEGVCVGRRFAGIEWKVVRIIDGPIPTLAAVHELPSGEIGELIVKGLVVTDSYVNRPQADAVGKIAEGGAIWHRMGDAGCLDAKDRFWFCGRVAHRVLTSNGPLYTIPCEAVFNNHPDIRRSALVGVGTPGSARPVIVLEPVSGRWPRGRAARERLLNEVHALGRGNPLTTGIDDFLLHRSFPVDVRHNAKIFREKLAVWAARQRTCG
jgi:acyl-CoA synthetase (AMP-forming)/AMP-acid ligase II